MPKDTLTHKLLVDTTNNITKRTNGKVTFEVFGPEIGDWTELDVMNKKGTVEYVLNATPTGFDPRWNLFVLPFISQGFAETKVVGGPGGVFDQMGKQWAPDGGQYYLGTFINNIGMLGMKSKVVKTPEEAKGLKIRVWPQETPKVYVAKMGFTPVTIPWAEAPTAVSTGIVDGWVGAGSVYHYTLFRDVAKVQIKTFDFFETWYIEFTLDKWKQLPKEYQDIIQDESTKAQVIRLGQLEEEENMYSKKLVDYGWNVVDMPKDYPKELKRWADLGRESWEVLDPVIGKIWVDKLRVALGMPVK
jgi:TRAP-type C4-dicarboxylate transport system substrate-binding protein